MASSKDVTEELARRWHFEAADLERLAQGGEYSTLERKQLEMHARVKRGCAVELRNEVSRVRRG